MKLSEKKGGDFSPHPETEGTVKAVIVDVTPTKKVQSEFGERDVFRLVFETEVKDEDGKQFCIWSRPYTPSLNEKANFRKDVKKIMGRDLTTAELEEFDTEALLGMGVKLIIQHEEGRDGKTYATLSFIGPDKDKTILIPSGKYTRVKDRPEKGDAAGGGAGYRSAPKAGAEEGRAPWQKVKVHVGKHAGVDLGDLDEVAVGSLIEKWLPVGKAMPKPLKADRDLIAALDEAIAEIAELMGEEAAPVAESEY